MRSRTAFALTTALTASSIGLTGGRAAAYQPGPLCAFPEGARAAFTPSRPLVPEDAPMCAPHAQPRPERPIDAEQARRALQRARQLAERGRHADAVLALRVAARVYPRLADRFALEEAEYRMADGADELACRAYERALE
ncbi:MAG TPA: hypothetical protein VIL20_21260, partial [Sandaracinaceae bacterium]